MNTFVISEILVMLLAVGSLVVLMILIGVCFYLGLRFGDWLWDKFFEKVVLMILIGVCFYLGLRFGDWLWDKFFEKYE